MEKFQESGVGPAKADDIDGIAAGSCRFGRAIHRIIFLSDGAIAAKVFGNCALKFIGKPIGLCCVAVAA